MPGQTIGRSIVPLCPFTSLTPIRYAPSLYWFDGTYARDPDNTPTSMLRAGLLVGKISTSGEGGGYANSIIGVTTVNYTSGQTTLTVTPQAAAELARRVGASGTFNITNGATATATGITLTVVTYSSLVASTGVITITNIGANIASGAAIMPTDGSQVPLTVFDTEYGTDVVGVDAGNINEPMHRFVIGADCYSANVINLTVVNAGTEAYLKTQLRASGGTWTFDDDR